MNQHIVLCCTAVQVSGKKCEMYSDGGKCLGDGTCPWANLPPPVPIADHRQGADGYSTTPENDVWSYGIAQGGTRTEVVDRVTEHLCNGWQCVGGISVVLVSSGRVQRYLYSQAMRKFIHKGRGRT